MDNQAKRLYRSVDDNVIAGVCGGIGEYLNIDPTLVRVIFALLAIIGGGGFILYLILWLVIPYPPGTEEKDNDDPEKKPVARGGGARFFIGVVLLLIGFLTLFNQLNPLPWFRWDLFWPIILVIAGTVVLLRGGRRT